MSSDCQRLVADEQLNSSPWSARHEQSAAGESARGGRRRPPVISRGRCASAFVEWLGERGRRGRRRRRGPGVDQGPFARRRIAGLPHARHGRRAGCGGGAQLRVANPGAAYFRARRAGDRLPGTPTGRRRIPAQGFDSHRDRQGGARLREGPRRGGALAGRGPRRGDSPARGTRGPGAQRARARGAQSHCVRSKHPRDRSRAICGAVDGKDPRATVVREVGVSDRAAAVAEAMRQRLLD